MNELSLADGRLAALRFKRGAIPVLALHGWLDNAHSFRPLADHLGDCELVALDFPGHGRSARRPPGTFYHFDDYVFDVLGALDALGWQRAHLIGHSLGGAVASVFSAAAPERVTSLTVIEGLGPLSMPPDTAAAGWRRCVDRSKLRPRRVHAEFESAVAARTEGSDLEYASAACLAERGLVEVDGGWQWGHDLRVTWPSPHRYTEAQVLDLLAAIGAPVLSILSDPPSGIVKPHLLRRRLAALADVFSLHAPGGHHLHMHHPDRIGPAITEHFSDHD